MPDPSYPVLDEKDAKGLGKVENVAVNDASYVRAHLSGRLVEHGLKAAGQMRLVRETGLKRNVDEGHFLADRIGAGAANLSQARKAFRRQPDRRFETAPRLSRTQGGLSGEAGDGGGAVSERVAKNASSGLQSPASAKAAASANGRSKEGANSVNGRNRPTRVGMPLPNKETPAPGCRRAPTRRCALCTTVLCAFSAGPVTPEKSDPEASDETHTETSPSGGIT